MPSPGISILAPQGRWTPIKTHTPTHHNPAITSPKSQPALAPLTPNPYQRGNGFARTLLPFKKGAEGEVQNHFFILQQ